MPTCPLCGSTRLGDGDPACPDCGARLDEEALIASWLDAPAAAGKPQEASAEPSCTACGYAGELVIDAATGATSCPACLVVIPSRRDEGTVKVARVIKCPECGQDIGLAKGDEGKTVICPGCSCFLGTFDVRRAR
ncbi:MAG TPA: hypothetical protein VGH66_12620 [Acidimicrobiales bacterium]